VKIRPMRNRLLVKLSEMITKTQGGILLPEEKRPTTGTVIEAGIDDLGEILNKGDVILFGKYAGTPIKLENEDFVMMSYTDIIAVVETTDEK